MSSAPDVRTRRAASSRAGAGEIQKWSPLPGPDCAVSYLCVAEADFATTESLRKQVPCGPGERSRQSHLGQGLPPICIRPAIGFIANTPLATRAGVVSSVVVRAIPSKKAMTSYALHMLGP